MYNKIMYEVKGNDNKVHFRLQDFTKGDNVNLDMFHEGKDKNGNKRLQCNVFVLHAEEYDTLKSTLARHKADIKELNNKIMQKNVEIKRLEQEVVEYKRANIDEGRKLADKHRDELDTLKEKHANELLAIDKQHRKHIENLTAQFNAKLDDANKHLFDTVKENNKTSADLRAEMLTMKETHKDEVVNLQKQHHNEIEQIQHAHADELQGLRDAHTYDIDTLKETIERGKQEHLVEVSEIQHKHVKDIDDMRAKFLKLLANEHAQDLSDFNECGELPFYVKPFARGFVKAFDEFKKRKEMNTPKVIVDSYEIAPPRDE